MELKANLPPMDGQWTELSALFPGEGKPGIAYQRGVVAESGPAGDRESLLYYNAKGKLVGVFDYFPNDIPAPEGSWQATLENPNKRYVKRAGDFSFIVDPEHQRAGIGTSLLENAAARWCLNFEQQDYTLAGASLVQKFLRRKLQRPARTPKRKTRKAKGAR